MSKTYFSNPLATRLKAFKLNGKTKLGHGWHEPPYTPETAREKRRWYWVPETTINTGLLGVESNRSSCHGTWGGEPFKLDGMSTELRWCEDLDGYFRNVKPAHEVISLRHTGWFVDAHQDETCHGLVMQLPGRDGKPIYLHGINDPWNDNTGMVAWRPCEWADNKEDAARWADTLAENYAEFCREDDAKQTAQHDIEEAKDRIKEIRTEVKLLVADTRQSGTLRPKVCNAVKHTIQELRAESRKLHRKITRLTDNHWNAITT